MKTFVAGYPYMSDVFTIKLYGENIYRITYVESMRQAGWEIFDDEKKKKKARNKSNDNKLENNLARAKSKVREYVLCNKWDYFVTLTFDPNKHDRYHIDSLVDKLTEFIHYYNKRIEENDRVKYVLIPEKHKDGAWHLHGVLKGIREKDLYINQYGYLVWKQFERKFGYISMDRVRNAGRSSSYILKYMTKDPDRNINELGKHLYYCSRGLQVAEEIYRGRGSFVGEWDWEHPDGLCKIKTIDVTKDDLYKYFIPEE